MSYPGYKYSSYSGQSTNDQSVQAYNRLNTPSASQSHQQTSVQYAQQQPYDWPQQNHQSTNANAGAQSYDSTAWKSEQDRSYSYSQRPQASPSNTSDSVASNGHHVTAAPPTLTGTTALNSLAYASGLESTGMNNRGTQPGNPEPTGYNPSRQQALERVTSSYDQNQAQRNDDYGMNRTPSAASLSQSQAQKSSYQTQAQQPINLTMTAIHDILSSQQAQPQYSNYRTTLSNQAPTNSQRKTQSPTMAYSSSNTMSQSQGSGNRAKASTPVGRAPQPASSSSWNPPPSQSHSRAPSAQSYTQAQYPTETAAPNTVTSTDHSTGTSYTAQNASHSTQGQAQTQETHRQDSPRSFANPGPACYGASNDKEAFTQYSIPLSPSQSSMPSFIDPSQVYNPYQQEYEKRKAAEEAEAARLLAEQKQREREEEQERQRYKESTPVMTEPAGEKRKKSRKSEPNPPNASNADYRRKSDDSATLQAAAFLSFGLGSVGDGSNDDDGTADEMQLMLQKIRQMKSKDPSKFQQLLGALTDDQPANSSTPQPSAQIATGTPYNATSRPDSVPRPISKSDSNKNFHYQPPERNPENLPDLGKFPVLRRMRNKLQSSQDAPAPIDNFIRVPSTVPMSPPRPASWSRPGTSSGTPDHAQDPSASGFKFPTTTNLKFQSSSGPPHAPSPPFLSTQKASSPRQVASQIPQPQPSTGASTRAPPTVWPQAKRKALAEAAVRTLLFNPLNRDKGLSPAVILQLLELNPSYPELCEKLEARGIALHRGNFAKSLLQSVPDLASSSQSAANTSSVVSPTTQATLKFQGAPLGQPGAQTVAQLNSSVAANSTSSGSPVIPNPELGSFNWKPTAIPGQTCVPGPTPTSSQRQKFKAQPPLTLAVPMGPKEAQARKRDFSDIVDLTQGLDDDDDETEDEDEPPRKEPRLDNPNIDPHLFFHKPAAPPNLPMKPAPTFGSNVPSDRQKEEVARRSSARANIDLVKPVKKTDALRRSTYNILTIARDVLLASGRHPTEAPLNAHLAKLTTRLPQIGYDADLSSLRWDVIDPGGPPVFQDESTRISPNQRFTSSGAKIGGLTTAQLNLLRVANKQREKREGQPPQSSLRNVVNLTSDIGSDRSTVVEAQVTRRAVSPPPPIPGSHYKSTPRNAIKPSKPMPPADSDSAPKRRGRPPGAKNKNPPKSQQLRQAAGVVIQVPRRPKDTLKHRSPEPISYNTYDCQWRGCQAKLHNLETLRKHFAKVHHYSHEHNTCLWEDCGTEEEVYDKPSNSFEKVHIPLKFNTRDDWSNHVVGAHLDPIGWSLGEGPSIRSNG
jgi:hypothetical protein